MSTALVNGRVLLDRASCDGHAVLIEGGRIAADRAATTDVPRGDRDDRSRRPAAVPGFIDVQVNGGGGVLFNDDPSVETIATIGRAHRRFGTTGFLPTLISDDLDVIAQRCALSTRRSRPACPACSASTSKVRSSTPSARASTTRRSSARSTRRGFELLTSLTARQDAGDARARDDDARR